MISKYAYNNRPTIKDCVNIQFHITFSLNWFMFINFGILVDYLGVEK